MKIAEIQQNIKVKIEESARTLNRNNKRMKFKRSIRKRGLTE